MTDMFAHEIKIKVIWLHTSHAIFRKFRIQIMFHKCIFFIQIMKNCIVTYIDIKIVLETERNLIPN
jgi:hypothetical protein